MDSNHNGVGPDEVDEEITTSLVRYDEVRQWIVLLNEFTVQELADTMVVSFAVAERFTWAAYWHGIIEETEVARTFVDQDGTEWDDIVFRHKPLPPGPREHFTRPPEWRATPGCYDLAPIRGFPVRIRSDRDTRRKMASDMSARHRLALQEKRWKDMQLKKQKRLEQQKERQRDKDEHRNRNRSGEPVVLGKGGTNKPKKKEGRKTK